MTDLISLERAAFSRTPDRTLRLQHALMQFVTGKLVIDPAQPDVKLNASEVRLRLAAAIAAILGDPATIIPPEQLASYLILAPDIVRLFYAAGFNGSDFLLRALAGPDGMSDERLAERLPLLSLDSALAWPPEFLATLPPAVAQQTMAQLISNKPVMTVHGQKRRDRLLDYASALPPAELPRTSDTLVQISAAWMICSYAGTPHKHAIKRVFNRTLRQMALSWGFADTDLPADRARKSRPLLLFAAEIMHSRHVQYRYFGQYLRQLRQRFELVLLTEDKEADDAVRGLFDRVLTFQRGSNAFFQQIYRMIVDTAPDIIFYPSVGMRNWGPLFANLRLAPIQLTALGHSASTFCDTIDYYLLEQGYVSDPQLFGETVLTVPDEGLIFERMPGFTPPVPQVRPAPRPLRIVLPSNVLKLNPAFIATIARVRAGTERPLEFHFVPNIAGTELEALRRMIHAALPGASIHRSLPYQRYAELLSACDLNLSPFPFGGLHSVIDSLRQGLPVVAMDCPEPHGRTDAMLLRRLGMPKWLIARSADDYVAAALRIINDDALRIRLSEQALALDINRTMFGDETTPLRSEIVDALWWVYQNHERVQADGRKLWSLADREAFSPSPPFVSSAVETQFRA